MFLLICWLCVIIIVKLIKKILFGIMIVVHLHDIIIFIFPIILFTYLSYWWAYKVQWPIKGKVKKKTIFIILIVWQLTTHRTLYFIDCFFFLLSIETLVPRFLEQHVRLKTILYWYLCYIIQLLNNNMLYYIILY